MEDRKVGKVMITAFLAGLLVGGLLVWLLPSDKEAAPLIDIFTTEPAITDDIRLEKEALSPELSQKIMWHKTLMLTRIDQTIALTEEEKNLIARVFITKSNLYKFQPSEIDKIRSVLSRGTAE